jgi:hypothetical protein
MSVNDALYQSILDSNNAYLQRAETYKKQYTQQDADRLAHAYLMYPWVNPEILASVVLSNNDDILPDIAKHAINEMGKVGMTPADISDKTEVDQRLTENYVRESLASDPSAKSLLVNMYRGATGRSDV